MSTIVMRRPVCRSRDRFVAAIFALAVPLIALADDGLICLQVPPGGSVQLKVPIDPMPIINEPTPIIIDLSAPGPGAVQGVTLLGAPNAAGTAVIDGNSLVIRTVSPPVTLGLSSGPMIAVTIAVPGQATTGNIDGAAPPGNYCVPNLVQAGSMVSRIEVVTAVETQLDGRLVSVTNPDLTGATYFSYLRATDLGTSARPLLAATEAIFPVQTLSSAVFAAPTSGTFFGLALQNPEPDNSTVSVELLNAGSVVASATLALPPLTKVSREVSELFPGVIPSADSVFSLTATVPVQMLGVSGNENDSSVTPVLPALASP